MPPSEPLRSTDANPAIAGRLDERLAAEPLSIAQLEEALDAALEMGRIDVARRLQDRIRALPKGGASS